VSWDGPDAAGMGELSTDAGQSRSKGRRAIAAGCEKEYVPQGTAAVCRVLIGSAGLRRRKRDQGVAFVRIRSEASASGRKPKTARASGRLPQMQMGGGARHPRS